MKITVYRPNFQLLFQQKRCSQTQLKIKSLSVSNLDHMTGITCINRALEASPHLNSKGLVGYNWNDKFFTHDYCKNNQVFLLKGFEGLWQRDVAFCISLNVNWNFIHHKVRDKKTKKSCSRLLKLNFSYLAPQKATLIIPNNQIRDSLLDSQMF